MPGAGNRSGESRTLPYIDTRVQGLSFPGSEVMMGNVMDARFVAGVGAKEDAVKSVISLLIAVVLASGCVAGSTVTHEDSPAAVQRDEGPALCRDGSVPPCNSRD
jgi:hypothetical protein